MWFWYTTGATFYLIVTFMTFCGLVLFAAEERDKISPITYFLYGIFGLLWLPLALIIGLCLAAIPVALLLVHTFKALKRAVKENS